MNWAKAFSFDTPPLEIMVRGTVMYLALYVLLRVVLKRETGITGMTDLLAVVLIADAAQNGMAGTYTSISDGILLVIVIIGWAFLLNWMAHRWRWASRIIKPQPLLMIRNGQLVRRNMRRELITDDQLREHARKQGIKDLMDVTESWMESDGQFSFITDGTQHPGRPR
ncbi:MAG TPA: YetF domain-containing protein [Mycobacterium sp.]|nr:YetF domain-containing protein [Mycobacterium sp.]